MHYHLDTEPPKLFSLIYAKCPKCKEQQRANYTGGTGGFEKGIVRSDASLQLLHDYCIHGICCMQYYLHLMKYMKMKLDIEVSTHISAY